MGAEQSQTATVEQLTGLRNFVSFLINGKEYIIEPEKQSVGPEALLVDFIRDRAFLKGTKFMCREGGCGACVVTVKTRNVHSGEETIRSVNSCLIPVFACDGWEITTVENLGNRHKGYHDIQQRMVKFNGTQCGFCSPGWVMNFYSTMQSKKQITLADIEDITDGNICRCTGYRPILDAVKSLAVDAPEELKRKWMILSQNRDSPMKSVEKTLQTDDFDYVPNVLPVKLTSSTSNLQWVKAVDMKTLFLAIQRFQSSGLKYRIVAGNTGTGVFKHDGPYDAFVELNSVYLLQKVQTTSSSLIIGGAVTISRALQILEENSSSPGFEYFQVILKHWKRVANVSVRNAGTLAGNLMLKRDHPEFPSDIFLVLETIGAMLTVASSPSLQEMCSLQQFLSLDMKGKIISSIHMPKHPGVQLRTFKITRRYQNAHAYVNAGFLLNLDGSLGIKGKPSIVFGGISPQFVHATLTEEYLAGKTLNGTTVQGVMETLEREVNPEQKLGEADPMYRKLLTQTLFYKFAVQLLGESIPPKLKSSCEDIERGPVYGKQFYEFDKSEWPLYEPMSKLEAPVQVSGEAEYVNDICPVSGEVHGAVAVTKYGKATIKSVDVSEALKLKGVLAWVDHTDIRGENNYLSSFAKVPDLIFVKDKIQFAGQPIGVIVAETRELASKAVKLIKVEYDNIEKPILDIQSALKKAIAEDTLAKFTGKRLQLQPGTEVRSPQAAPRNIEHEFNTGGQIHFPLEVQICICIPKEDGMDVICNAQSFDLMHIEVAAALGLPRNSVNVYIRRIGGGFGNKLVRLAHVCTMCAVSANKVGQAVRMWLDLETQMSMIGGRLPYYFKYQAGFDDDGSILNLNLNIFNNTGCSANEPVHFLGLGGVQNIYSAKGWTLTPRFMRTDLPPFTFCRSPGHPSTTIFIETVMEHIAFECKMDPMEFRLKHLWKKGDPVFADQGKNFEEENLIPQLWEEFKVTADISERLKFVENFNKENRWKKRGLAVIPTRHPLVYVFSDYRVFVAVYGNDGTVAVSHTGVEMGQGINTKVVQVVARKLNIPVGKIKVKATNSLIGANATFTGTGATTDKICNSAVKVCDILLERFQPVRAKLGNPTWEQLAAECKKLGMDLTCTYSTTFDSDKIKPYSVWGLGATEVEIDCLTGEYKIVRVDITSDAGTSLNADLDLGQIEGSFVMGLGWLLSEQVKYDPDTGECLTNRTWTYKPPMAKDLPGDFRVTLLKNVPNEFGVLRAKSVSEAPFVLSSSILFAMRRAIYSARVDAGHSEWLQIDTPVTPEDIQRLCLTTATQLKLSQ